MPTLAERQKKVVLGALDQFERPMLRYATRLLDGDEDLARDAVQHSFLKLCEQDVRKLPENLAPWLYTVCRNRAMDYCRKSRREPVVGARGPDAVCSRELEPSAQLEKSTRLGLVRELISQLAHSEREVAELWSQGFSNSEMAEVIGKSEGAVRVCLHRAVSSLRQHPAIRRWISDDERGTDPVTLATDAMGQS